MIRIHPNIEFEAKCPVDGMSLNASRILVPGMRCLADASCPACGARYIVDLPVGQAIRSPVTLNQDTGEIYDTRNVVWFSRLLKNAFLDKVESDFVPIVHSFFRHDRIVIVNCLDFLYGHSLLKLLNVQRYLDNHPDMGCCVLVPSQMLHLVPDGVAEIWEFPVPIKDGWKWYASLGKWMNMQILSRRECFLSAAYSHPSNRIYNLDRFVRNEPAISNEIKHHNPVVLFSCREDRLWGRNLYHQQRNLQKLYNCLGSVFPDIAFVMIGFGKKTVIQETAAKLIDLRYDKFDRKQDLLWMSYMKHADCAIGVHGSNMLLPSGLAKTTVALVPRSRLGNSVQDFLFSPSVHDIRDSLLFYRMLYGKDDLSDVQPSAVADMIVCLLSSAPYNSSWFKVGEQAGAINNANSVSNTEHFKDARKYFGMSSGTSFIKKASSHIAKRISKIID